MNALAGAAQRHPVAARLERLPMTGYQRRLFAIIAAAWFFDSMDLGIMTFVLGSIQTEFALTPAQTGLLASSSFVGMFFGAATAGLLAHKGAGSLMCGLSHTVDELMRYRVLLGFGMGMEFPIGLVSRHRSSVGLRWPSKRIAALHRLPIRYVLAARCALRYAPMAARSLRHLI